MELLSRTRASDSERDDDLLCVEVSLHDPSLVACASEAGTVSLYDARSWALSSRLRDTGGAGEAVSALAFHPSQPHTLFAASGCDVMELDVRQTPPECGAQPRALRRFSFCSEEVNAIVVSARGDTLCCASDSGEVAVVSLASGKLERTLRRGHSNIVSGLAFRTNRPTELVSVGMDTRCVCWELGTGRLRRYWVMSEVLGGIGEAGLSGTTQLGGTSQLFNPPLAHSVSVGEKDAAGAARFAAVACGDGSIVMLELEEGKKGSAAAAARKGPSPGAWALTGAAGGHTGCAAVAVRFPAFSAGAPLLLSAGNDGRALLWDWGKHVAGEDAAATVTASVNHGAKVNWLATGVSESGAGRVYLADTSPVLAEYAVR